MDLDMNLTLAIGAAALAAALVCGWRGAQPPNPLKGPRLMPWRPLMVASASVFMLMLVHAVNLMGLHTGRQ